MTTSGSAADESPAGVLEVLRVGEGQRAQHRAVVRGGLRGGVLRLGRGRAHHTKVSGSVGVGPRAKRSRASGAMSTVRAWPSAISSAMSWPAMGPCMNP